MGGIDIGTDKHRYLQIDTDDTYLGEHRAHILFEFRMQIMWRAKPTTFIFVDQLDIYIIDFFCNLN